MSLGNPSVQQSHDVERSQQTTGHWSGLFRWVFSVVVILSLVTLGLAYHMSQQPQLNSTQLSMLETLSTSWKLGFGAIVGMIGGRAT